MTELSAATRFVHLTAAVLLLGGFTFSLSIARPAFQAAAAPAALSGSFFAIQLRIARASLALLFISAVVGLWIQTASVSDPSLAASFSPESVKTLLTETQYGTVWIARMVLSGLLLALLLCEWFGWVNKDSFVFIAAGLVLSACLLMSLALSGHAAAADGSVLVLQVSTDALHLAAAGVWLGGLVPLAILLQVARRRIDPLALLIAAHATQRFSRLGLVGVGALVVSGACNAWFLVGTIPALVGTPYGRLLLLKIALLFPLLAVASVNLLQLRPRLLAAAVRERQKTVSQLLAKLKRNVIVEVSLGLVVLSIVGALGVTPPARHRQPEWPFSFRLNWNALEGAPKARAEVERGVVWGAVGLVAMLSAVFRRRRRFLVIAIGIGTVSYAVVVIKNAVSIDAYPTTYRRPAVAYQAISVANGMALYRDSCVVCHGIDGYGDGPAAQDLNPKPADLTARHANDHTAGDLYWWLSHGVQLTAMPGFGTSLSEEERWDLINFMRALSSADRARSLASIIEDEAWLVAPDFAYATERGETKALKDHRGSKIVLLVLFTVPSSGPRLQQLDENRARLEGAGVEVLLVPMDREYLRGGGDRIRLNLPVVTDGSQEIAETYGLFHRSLAEPKSSPESAHMEILIDKQGYVRARWLAAEGEAWRKLENLMAQVDILRKEKPRAPAPDEHVH
jgi:putative copper export protein/mono/diheme cytochrome c family protein/peroxiredoxin